MARLDAAAQPGFPPPLSSHTSTDDEAATQQLLFEDSAFATWTPQPTTARMTSNPPPSSAARAAASLNAARKNVSLSSPARAMPRSGNGKLARVNKGLYTEPSRKLLGSWRRSIYDVPDSPEKGFKLPETVNHNLLKVRKKTPVQQAERSGAVVPSSDLPEPSLHDGDEQPPAEQQSPLPSSPPQPVPALNRAEDGEEQSANDSGHDNVQIEVHRSDGATRCSAVSYKEKKGYEQCHNKSLRVTKDGPRCNIHMGKPGRARCKHVSRDNGDVVRCPRPELNGTGRCSKHATIDESEGLEQPDGQSNRLSPHVAHGKEPAQSGAKRKSAEPHNPTGRATKSRRRREHGSPGQDTIEVVQPSARRRGPPKKVTVSSHPEVQIPMRQRKRQDAAVSTARNSSQAPVSESIEDAEPTQSKRSGRRGVNAQAQTDSAAPNSTGATKSTNGFRPVRRSQHDFEVDADEAEDEEDGDEEARTAKHPPGTIERVFKFLDLDDREGGCQTDLGITLNRICEETLSHLQGDDLAIEDVAEIIDNIRGKLEQVMSFGRENTESRGALKEDVFGYGFRSLTAVLLSTHDCLVDMYGDFMQSLVPMRIITGLMRDILGLKQTIAGWKVKTTQRYKGDRIIRDVDTHLVVPLREVHTIYRNRLSQLESNRQQAARLRRENEEREEEQARELEAKNIQTQRWKRWHALHVMRLQCEPVAALKNTILRNKQRHADFAGPEEMDANGIPMERVKLFGDRRNPPQMLASKMAEPVKWSEEEDGWLIQGLRACAGPNVFEEIFQNYCRPGGMLRRFSAAQIVAKAMSIKTDMLRWHQERDQKIPRWLREMPSLP